MAWSAGLFSIANRTASTGVNDCGAPAAGGAAGPGAVPAPPLPDEEAGEDWTLVADACTTPEEADAGFGLLGLCGSR